ncbi:hypothetical protein GJ496_004679 [Pomphorhynchus laevis]|nr:hypothetical protein GJ496_004679 [Pomphorhynchus laevis]
MNLKFVKAWSGYIHQTAVKLSVMERYIRASTINQLAKIDDLNITHMRLVFGDDEISPKSQKRAISLLKNELSTKFDTTNSQVYGPLSRSKRYYYPKMNDNNPTWAYNRYPKSYYYSRVNQYRGKSYKKKSFFNDPLLHFAWYCRDINNNGMNIAKAWDMGYSGKGVSICILDDGLDYRHPELQKRYRRDISHDFNDLSDIYKDPMPSTFDGQNSHGTKCAGIAAAEGNNGMCGVGAAYNAYIGAHRILDGTITALTEGRSLAYRNHITDIKSLSWGPTDDGKCMEKPNIFSLRALDQGVTTGRRGLGTLFVWASGNGGKFGDHCGADAYVANHNVIAIGCINKNGKLPFFTEYCPAVMAVAYTGGVIGNMSENMDPSLGCVTTDVLGKCCRDFVGTSAAAPLAAGIFALVLEANPRLTYRDVMHIVTQTARIPGSIVDASWKVNGAGYLVSELYGFGVIDASRMIETALTWENIDERQQCDIPTIQFGVKDGRIVSGGSFSANIAVSSCPLVEALEHVIVYLTMSYPYRGDIRVVIESPSGTSSNVLEFRPLDNSKKGIHHFPFMTTHCWGESPIGTWKVRVEAKSNRENYVGSVSRIGLRLFGTTKWTISRFYQRSVNVEN